MINRFSPRILKEAKSGTTLPNSLSLKEKGIMKDLANYSFPLESLTNRLAILSYIPADEIYKTLPVLGDKRDVVKKEFETLAEFESYKKRSL